MSKILQLDPAVARVNRGFQYYWDVIKELSGKQKVFTAEDVARKCARGAYSEVADYIGRLRIAGYLEVASSFGDVEGYRLLRRQLNYPRIRRDGTVLPTSGQQCLWNAIRQLGWFTPDELRIAASIEEYQPTPATVRSYLLKLKHAGYLSMRKGARGVYRYRLQPAMNTGPMAPQILRTKAVYDPNRQKIMEIISVKESS
ncbi:hypothetical protein [Polycladidibacter hongkongensis]|uniref:hypothetical protein n=1 Tax=Polycladidibacter hongkongensis TaxID=1647556 RepID=UPI00082DF784|nr:hypothetical protein [Pseudovibrio hongkongensis]